MTVPIIALSTWLHTLATIVMIGHYVFTSLVYLPTFERRFQAAELRELLESSSSRLRPYFGGSLLIFIITGTHLMMINKSYLGLGDFFGNSWSTWIVIKHVIVLVFIALAIISERLFLGQISDEKPQALKQFRFALGTNLVLGMVILLFTAIAQAV
jgi:uncharacterized membrane protein